MKLHAQYDHDERRAAFSPEARWVTAGGVRGFWSHAFGSGWTLAPPPADPARIRAHRDAMVAAVGSIEWTCFSWDGPQPWYADAALRTCGYRQGDEELILVRSVPGLERSALPSGLSVRRATRPADREILSDADRVHEQVWGPQGRPSALLEAFQPGGSSGPYLSVHVAYLDRQPVAYGRLQHTPGSRFVGLFAGATIPAARGRGCYRALVGSRAREAAARGVTQLTVDADPTTSAPILTRLGFVALGRARPYLYHFGPHHT